MPAGALIHDALSKLYNVSRKAEMADQIRDMLAGEGAPEKVRYDLCGIIMLIKKEIWYCTVVFLRQSYLTHAGGQITYTYHW